MYLKIETSPDIREIYGYIEKEDLVAREIEIANDWLTETDDSEAIRITMSDIIKNKDTQHIKTELVITTLSKKEAIQMAKFILNSFTE